ncbi:unnamed protein product [Rangifer tarandus platyrhynchus]|uniref:Uncharacterized protein n=2 Tax=Rangifer tarandus platyrhynchus TaxID=3082113 RepID=A0AC59YBF7_RANTA|nr:unnamed protein product [Rangifer tarandus platyrhynchus]
MKGLPHREPRIVLGAEGWGSALDSCAPRETLHCKLVPLTHTRNHHLKLMVKHLQLSGTTLGKGRGHDLEAPVALVPAPHPGQTHFQAPLWLLQPPQRAVPWLEWSMWDALPAPPQLPPTRATSLGPGDISAPSICEYS